MILFAKIFGLKKISIVVAVILTAFFSLNVFGATEVDSTLNPAVTKDVTSNFTGNLTLQPDGKILIFGTFQTGGTYLIRLNTDGTTDTSFNCLVCNFINVSNAAVTPDGKIMVAGFADIPKVYRLNYDGSLDSSFNANITSGLSFTYEIEIVAVQPDGKILLRQRSLWQGYTLQEIIRYNTDGTRDSSFSINGYGPLRFSQANYSRVMVLPNGKILFGGTVTGGFNWNAFLYRTNADGTTDTTFERPTITDSGDNRSSVGYFDVYPDGSIIVPGKFTSVNSINKTDLVKLLPAGNVDLNFTPDAVFTQPSTFGGRAFVLPDGKVLVNTIVSTLGGPPIPPDNRLYRFNSDGTIDNTYNTPAELTFISPLAMDSSNRILAIGVLSGVTRYLRLNTDGSLDSSFNPTLIKRGIINRLAVQPDGKILMFGDFNRVNGTVKNNSARINVDGTLDTTFDSGTGFDVVPREITVQADGKILAIGDFTLYNGVSRMRIVRLNPDGSLDSAFNPDFNGYVNAIAVTTGGKILVGGNFSTVNGSNQARIARLNPDGNLDTSFNPVFGTGEIYSIFVQLNGQIMVGGAYTGVNGFNRSNLVRLNSDGTMDASFNSTGVSNVNTVIQQPDGKYLLMRKTSNPDAVISRLESNGSTDANFQSFTITGTVNAMWLQSDGKILVGGSFYLPKANIARFLPNGTADTTFLQTGANNTVYAIVGQADGKILVGGNFVTIDNILRSGIARLTTTVPQIRTIFDYDGDGRADVSVFRPVENKWYVMRSSDGVVYQPVFGLSSDVPVPADYDGDSKTDIAIFRPSTGDWWYLSSVDNSQRSVHWGASGDIPRPSDFDGDGKADFIIFRPAENNWYRMGSTGAVSIVNFGLAGDKPVVGDFDGDGKSDVAIYRPSTGDWWYQSSINNAQLAVRWGISTDIPAPADYDGDGRTDVAVYRASEGVWYILNSSNLQATIMRFGLAEDKPVAADYDGDGRADIAVFRPSTGVWYLLRTTSGFTAQQFGVSTDVPTEYAFVP